MAPYSFMDTPDSLAGWQIALLVIFAIAFIIIFFLCYCKSVASTDELLVLTKDSRRRSSQDSNYSYGACDRNFNLISNGHIVIQNGDPRLLHEDRSGQSRKSGHRRSNHGGQSAISGRPIIISSHNGLAHGGLVFIQTSDQSVKSSHYGHSVRSGHSRRSGHYRSAHCGNSARSGRSRRNGLDQSDHSRKSGSNYSDHTDHSVDNVETPDGRRTSPVIIHTSDPDGRAQAEQSGHVIIKTSTPEGQTSQSGHSGKGGLNRSNLSEHSETCSPIMKHKYNHIGHSKSKLSRKSGHRGLNNNDHSGSSGSNESGQKGRSSYNNSMDHQVLSGYIIDLRGQSGRKSSNHFGHSGPSQKSDSSGECTKCDHPHRPSIFATVKAIPSKPQIRKIVEKPGGLKVMAKHPENVHPPPIPDDMDENFIFCDEIEEICQETTGLLA